jgi:hypothetical protein
MVFEWLLDSVLKQFLRESAVISGGRKDGDEGEGGVVYTRA